jgi:hypothetical protein
MKLGRKVFFERLGPLQVQRGLIFTLSDRRIRDSSQVQVPVFEPKKMKIQAN